MYAGPSNRDLATIQSHMLDGVNTSVFFLAQAVAPVSRSELRWEFANTAAAVTLFFRRSRCNRTLQLSLPDARPHTDLLQPCSAFSMPSGCWLISLPFALSSTSRQRFGVTSGGSSRIYSFSQAASFFTKSSANTSESSFAGFSPLAPRHSCRAIRRHPSRSRRLFFRLQFRPHSGGRHYPPRP